MQGLASKTIFITGASRGIGRAMALKFAQDGANIVLAAKTSEPHPTLPGTIHSVAEEVEALGGHALAIQLDVREETKINTAIEMCAKHFGGLDILINNASAISLASTLEVTSKQMDLMTAINSRATFLCSKAAIPHLLKSKNPHILTMSPPLNMQAQWFKNHLAYTLSKYSMSMCTLGMAEEFKQEGIAVNSLWPKTIIATKAIEVHFPKEIYNRSRRPEIVADAAYIIVNKPSRECSGQFFIDETVLRSAGVENFEVYALQAGANLLPDLFI
jgi:citronellol/citronellal dehydrogenase